jgi:two-component system chemotaxis response regulator CheY
LIKKLDKISDSSAIKKKSPKPNKRLRFLVVDDDAVSRQKMKKILETVGDCTIVDNGQKAIALFLTALDENRFFHLITLNYSMPELSGLEVLSLLRKLEIASKVSTRDCSKIIMVSSHSGKENVIACLQAGCDEYMVKPFDKKAVFQRLQKLKVINP